MAPLLLDPISLTGLPLLLSLIKKSRVAKSESEYDGGENRKLDKGLDSDLLALYRMAASLAKGLYIRLLGIVAGGTALLVCASADSDS